MRKYNTTTTAVNDFVVIQKSDDLGKVNNMTLTLDQAKLLRDQLDDAIDNAHLNIEQKTEEAEEIKEEGQ